MSRPNDRGVILVWAVATVAVLTMLALSIARLAAGSQHTTAHLADRQRADALLRSGLVLAEVALEAHVRLGGPDRLDPRWREHTSHVGLGTVELRIEDAARRIDLNAVELRPTLRRLLDALDLPTAIVPALADWTDADDTERYHGAERAWYAQHGLGIVPTNAPLRSVHHARHIRGVTRDVLERLAPYVTVDGHPAINPNTAPPPVLRAWLDDPTRVGQIVRARRTGMIACRGFSHCTTQSRRYLVHLRARTGDVERRRTASVLVGPGLRTVRERWEPSAERGG